MTDLDYMKLAYQEALKAKAEDEVPIGAILVKDEKVIASGYNQKEHHHDATAHAEMIAIRAANQKLHSWHLEGCILYTTLEPCMMCSGAIIQSHISKVVYAAKGQRWHGLKEYLNMHKFNHYPEIVEGVMEKECSSLISDYFKEKR